MTKQRFLLGHKLAYVHGTRVELKVSTLSPTSAAVHFHTSNKHIFVKAFTLPLQVLKDVSLAAEAAANEMSQRYKTTQA